MLHRLGTACGKQATPLWRGSHDGKHLGVATRSTLRGVVLVAPLKGGLRKRRASAGAWRCVCLGFGRHHPVHPRREVFGSVGLGQSSSGARALREVWGRLRSFTTPEPTKSGWMRSRLPRHPPECGVQSIAVVLALRIRLQKSTSGVGPVWSASESSHDSSGLAFRAHCAESANTRRRENRRTISRPLFPRRSHSRK